MQGPPTPFMRNGKGDEVPFSWRDLRRFVGSYARPELPRRDAEEALEVIGELALIREPGVCGDLRQGQFGSGFEELPGPLDAAQDVDAVEAMVADVQGGTAVLAGVALDIKHPASANGIPGPGGPPGKLSLPGHTLPLVLPGQPLVLAFFRPVVCEPVMLSSALRRMASERAWSVTTRETVSAPIRVNAATSARLLASSGVPSSTPPARASTSFKNPAVAADRVCVSARAISLPSAASGQPSRGLSRCSVER